MRLAPSALDCQKRALSLSRSFIFAVIFLMFQTFLTLSPLGFYIAALSSRTLPGLGETDPLIAAFRCLFCLTQSLWALYKCLAQVLPLPSPSTSLSHSAILRASLAPRLWFWRCCQLNSCADSSGEIFPSVFISGSLTLKQSNADTSVDTNLPCFDKSWHSKASAHRVL